jgi:hypothetical protein
MRLEVCTGSSVSYCSHTVANVGRTAATDIGHHTSHAKIISKIAYTLALTTAQSTTTEDQRSTQQKGTLCTQQGP